MPPQTNARSILLPEQNRNCFQVVIALSGGEIIYFELDAIGQLIETEKQDMNVEVAALAVGPIPEGRLRSRFLAVAALDSTVRLVSLDASDPLHVLAVQAVPAVAESLLFLLTTTSTSTSLFLQMGLSNGILLRTEIGQTTGALADTRTRFLGTRPPKLFAVKIKGENGMLALTSRPWVGFSEQGRYVLVPLSYEVLDYAASTANPLFAFLNSVGRFCIGSMSGRFRRRLSKHSQNCQYRKHRRNVQSIHSEGISSSFLQFCYRF